MSTRINHGQRGASFVAESAQDFLDEHTQTPTRLKSTPSQSYPEGPTSPITSQDIMSNNLQNVHAQMEQASQDSTPLDMLTTEMKATVHTLVNRLRGYGVEDDLGMPLPQIAVIGNQSAGKSSLIEAISGISVPRMSGTCTRCPMEIILTESEPTAKWQCTIRLRTPFQLVKSRRQNPWTQTSTKTTVFMRLTSKDEVEDAIRKAQRAILNPSTDPQTFAHGDFPRGRGKHQQEFEVKFSPNVIVIDIAGPNLPNLTFFDLPGIIQATETEEEKYLIPLVKSLVKSYITKDHCLVLLALTMKDDAANQSALQMANEFAKNRTIGTLTKPDTVSVGDHDQWAEIVRGSQHKFQHPWFVTKQPNQEQLARKITHEEARLQEQEFFSTQSPWCDDLSENSSRFGTEALQSYLSQELSRLIRNRLPGIRKLVYEKMQRVEDQLKLLPAPPADNTFGIIKNLLWDMQRSIEKLVEGVPGHMSFSCNVREHEKTLQGSLKELRPRLNMNDSAEFEADSPYRFFLEEMNIPSPFPIQSQRRVDSTDVPDVPQDPHTPSNSRKRAHQQDPFETPNKKPKKRPSEIDDHNPASPNNSKYKPIHLKEIGDVINRTGASGLPGEVDTPAIAALCRLWIRQWPEHVDVFCGKMALLLVETSTRVFETTFQQYQASVLFDKIPELIEAFNEDVNRTITSQMTTLLQRELNTTITNNEDDFAREKQKALDIFKHRRKVEVQENADNTPDQMRATPSKGPRVAYDFNNDPFAREIEAMSKVAAYTFIQRKRFCDYVTLYLNYDILGGYAEHLRKTLEAELGLLGNDAEEKCRMLMVQDPESEARRKQLLSEKELLNKAKLELQELQTAQNWTGMQ